MKMSLVMGFVVIRLDLVIRVGKKSTSQFSKVLKTRVQILPTSIKGKEGRWDQNNTEARSRKTVPYTIVDKLLHALPVSSFNDHLINYD